MSQSHPEGPMWGPLTLVKFSYVTYPSNSICSTWNHLTSNNLKLVIHTLRVVDDHGTHDQRLMMRVSKGPEILISQDLDRLSRIRQRDPSMVEGAQNSPRIAMRYPTSEGVTQKFEMRFSTNEDFIVVVEILRSLGLPMREGGSSQKQALPIPRPPESPSPAPLALVSSSQSKGAGCHIRPSSASSSANHDRSSSLAGLSQYANFKIPERPANVEGLQKRPGSCLSASGALDSFANSSPLPTPSQARAASVREPTRSLYLSQQERETDMRRPTQPLLHETTTSNMTTQTKPSFFLRQLEMQSANSTGSSGPGLLSLSKSPFFSRPLAAIANASKQSSDPFRVDSMSICQEDVSKIVMNLPRTDSPTILPSVTSTELQDMMIPPRRQLPIDRSVSTPADLQGLVPPPRRELPFSPPDVTPRPFSAADLPPLPKPTPVMKRSTKKPADLDSFREQPKLAPLKRVAQRRAPTSKISNSRASSPLKTMARESTITPPTRHEDAPSPLAAKSAAASRPASAASGLVSKAVAPAPKRVAAPIRPPSSTKRPKTIDQSTQTQTLSGRDHTAKEKVSTTNDRTANTFAIATPTPPAPPQSFLDDLDTFVANHKDRPDPKEVWQKPGYAEADEDQRHKMLNDFICQNLDNADFLQLCADTEVAWRKVGLGM